MLVGLLRKKAPFKLKDIWALRVRLQMESRVRELALFNLGIDSKLRGCDLVSLKVRDICHGDQVASRAVVMQHKDSAPRPVRDHGRDSRGSTEMDQASWPEVRRLRLSQPHPRLTSPRNAAVRSDPRELGRGTRA